MRTISQAVKKKSRRCRVDMRRRLAAEAASSVRTFSASIRVSLAMLYLAVILSEGFSPSRRTPCELAQYLAPQGTPTEPHRTKCLDKLLVASADKFLRLRSHSLSRTQASLRTTTLLELPV